MKKKGRVSLMLMGIILMSIIGCNEEKTEEKCNDCNLPFQLESSSKLADGILYQKTLRLISNNNLPILKSAGDSSVTMCSYMNTDVKALIVELSSNEANVNEFFVTYALNENVLNDYLVIKFEEIDEITKKTAFFNSSGQLLGDIVVQNNNIIEAYSESTKSANGFWSKWNQCVKNFIDYIGEGTTESNITFLGCLAFGPECAAGTATGCAFVALTN